MRRPLTSTVVAAMLAMVVAGCGARVTTTIPPTTTTAPVAATSTAAVVTTSPAETVTTSGPAPAGATLSADQVAALEKGLDEIDVLVSDTDQLIDEPLPD